MLSNDPNNYVHRDEYFRTRHTQSQAFQELEAKHDQLLPARSGGRILGRNRTEYETNSNVVQTFMDAALTAMKAPTDDRFNQPQALTHQGEGYYYPDDNSMKSDTGFNVFQRFFLQKQPGTKRNDVSCRFVGKYNDVLFGMLEKPVVTMYQPPPIVNGDPLPPLHAKPFY